ncbi:uncharacterized protein [Diadema antillarum]|uniref:uncharacterized protein n=1 Tax=Diadema antillarum TaxID=105358 RepID=UPI003A867FD1
MSRRKQPAPVRLPDLEEGEGAGMGKLDQASEVTRRSAAKGHHIKDRKQPTGLNGFRGERSPGTRPTTRTSALRHMARRQADMVHGASRYSSRKQEEEPLGSPGREDSAASNGRDSLEGGDERACSEEEEDSASAHGASTPDSTSCAEDTRERLGNGAAGPVAESERESPLGGGGTTAGEDQPASVQQLMTGGGGEERGERAADHAEDDENACDVGEENPGVNQQPPSQTLLDVSSAVAAAGAVVSAASTATEDSEQLSSSGNSGSSRGSEEVGMGESAALADRCDSQEGETKSSDGECGLSVKSCASSPDNSSVGSTPSKNSMKRRRPFESPESLTCQVCGVEFPTAHELTLHVRTHNTASSHSCNICGKKLSSTSSLDRHMLIHSGERPFTCPLCSMSFTTNGNMHRHLRTHEKGGELPPPDYVVKHDYAKPRKRVPSRRVLENIDADYSPQMENQSPKKKLNVGEKKLVEKKVTTILKVPLAKSIQSEELPPYISDQPMDLSSDAKEREESDVAGEEKKEEELLCPICNKTFLCRYGLQTHIEQHPNKVLKCVICDASFKNQKGLRMHVQMAHRKNKSNNFSKQALSNIMAEKAGLTMSELSFVEFSSPKFPLIAQVWCEKHSPQTNNMESKCTYSECNKLFPCQSALKLHQEKSHSNSQDMITDLTDSEDKLAENEEAARQEFLAALNLKPRSPPQSPEKTNQPETADSTRTAPILNSMLNRPALSPSEKGNTSLLQQQLQASPLLGVKHFSNPLAAQIPPRQSCAAPLKLSPVKGMTASSILPCVKAESKLSEAAQAVNHCNTEPKSGDIAQEMHTPREFAKEDHQDQDGEVSLTETDGAYSESLEEIDEEPCDLSSPSNKKKGTHVCKYCKKVFPFASTLKVHTRSHMGLMPYKCMLCEYASADKSTLVRHMRTHSGERPYACKLCDFAFTTKANCERHVRKRHEKKTKEEAEEVIIHNPVPKHENENKYSSPCTVCKICNRDFKFFRDLQNHLRVHEKTPQKPFTCTKCQVGFSSLSNCARHILKRHTEVNSDEVESFITVYQHEEDESAPIIKDLKKESTSDSPVLNDQGEQVEPLDFSLKKNQEEKSNSAIPTQRRTSIYTEDSPIDLSMPKSELPQNLTVRTTSSAGMYRFKEVYRKFYSETIDALVCPHCTMTFQRGTHLKTHIRTHTDERPFRCMYCAAAFTFQTNLDAHIMRRHSNVEPQKTQQSFIPKSATPMQFKLMAKSASGLRYSPRAPKTQIPMVSPNTPVGASQQVKLGPSPHNSMGSDSSGELASVSKMLAATDSNHFKPFLSPPETRSPITVGEIFHQADSDSKDDERDEIFANITGDPPEMRADGDTDESLEGNDDNSQVEHFADDSIDLSTSVKQEDTSSDQYLPEYEQEGELQIVEDQLTEEQNAVKKEEEDKKEKKGNKFESKQCCPYCGRRFPWISSLRRHILTHTGLKPYQCPQCGANFSTKSNCERHIVRRHGGARPGSLGGSVPGGQDQPFMCPECKEFKCTTRTQLQSHYEQSHPHINFSTIYPEAKKVASTSIDIVSKKLESKLTSDTPLCLSTTGDAADKKFKSDAHTDLSLQSKSNFKKKSKPKFSALKVKMFVNKSNIAAAATDLSVSSRTPADNSAAEDEEEGLANGGTEYEDLADGEEQRVAEADDDPDDQVGEEDKDQSEKNDAEDKEMEDDQQGSEDGEQECSSKVPSGSQALSHGSQSTNPRPTKGKKSRAQFECTQCCKRFKTALTLERHEKVHEVEHPYHCTDCKATFTTKFNCQRHMIKLHRKKKDELNNTDLREDCESSLKNGLVNGEDVKTGSSKIAEHPDQELEDLSNTSLNLGDSVSAMGDSLRDSRNGTPVSFKASESNRKRSGGSQAMKKTKCPKLDEALMSGAVIDLQGNSDKLMAVENWLNSDIQLKNDEVNGYAPEGYEDGIPMLNPRSPTSSQDRDSQRSAGKKSGQQQQKQQQQGLYMASFLEDEDSLVAQDVANPSDVFSGGQGEEKNSDIISNLLGIQDASVLDQMLESADSAARLLGVADS